MVFDYSKLNGRIIEKYGSRQKFAEAFGVSDVAVSKKLNNKSNFSVSDIIKSCNLLEISKHEIADYFFNQKV